MHVNALNDPTLELVMSAARQSFDRPAAERVLPLLGVAGTRGKSTIAWMLTAIVRAAGKSSAGWLSSGVYVDGERQRGELGPWSKVVMAARYGEIDLAIQEMDSATVVSAGLPKDTYPVAVLTTLCGNNEACLLTHETELTRRALDKMVRAVRTDGRLIANADDYDIAAVAEDSEAEVIYYALHRDNPVIQRHLQAGGTAAWVADQQIVIGSDDSEHAILAVEAIPATLDGTILFQIRNALAAASSAVVLGLPLRAIADGLLGFEPHPELQPGASNIIRYNDATILIDAPSEIGSLRMLVRGIRNKPHRRTIVVSGGFPRLTDEEALEAGRLLGDLAGIVLLHNENSSDQRMDVVLQGIAAATVPPIVLRVANEARAIDHLLNSIAPSDAALVIADDPSVALAHLWPAPRIGLESNTSRRTAVGYPNQ